MAIPIYQVDAFSERPFSGNPAAVCLLDAPRPDDWMQNVAGEMNLSETAFVSPLENGFSLRWFTPIVEVDLCGHATLAAAHVLWETGRLPESATACFETRGGRLTARRDGKWIELDFPATPAEATETPDGLAEALGCEPRAVLRSRFDYLVEVESEQVLAELAPDSAALAKVPARGVIVTCLGTGRYDFVSRFFGPGAGIAEDPVTGSAHCCLGPYWAARLGKTELLAYQASARGGEVCVRVEGDRVLLGGKAVTVMRGELA